MAADKGVIRGCTGVAAVDDTHQIIVQRLTRFTLRGQHKVDAQWLLFGLVQNIEKLAHLVYAQ